MATYDAHDTAVTQRINNYILQANVKFPKETVALKLEWCWSENIKQREASAAASVDTEGRDSDYYFAARHTIAADKSQFFKYFHKVVGEVAMDVYTGLKVVDKAAQKIGAPPFMRSNKQLPNAPPGGGIWEERGASDGMLDQGQRVAPVPLHSPKP